MIINLLCKSFIAISEILLFDFYFKNIYSNFYKKQFKYIKPETYLIVFISLLFVNNIIKYIFIHIGITLFLIIILSFYHINKFDLIKKIMFYFVLTILSLFTSIIMYSFLFNVPIFSSYLNISKSFTTLTYIISNYIVYVILIIKIQRKNNSNLKYFKITCISIFTYFSMTFVIKNPIIFFTPSIARTYIFTVVISIVALICFDRMQAKYEAEKHSQEAVIQNMTKEIEFIKQLEKQQEEIREINHNLNNMLIILQSHLNNKEYDEAKEYIEKNLKIHVQSYQSLIHTGLTSIDSTINYQMSLMKEKNIEYHEEITKIMHLGNIKADDLSLMISLALDNAREACEKVEGKRHISLNIQSKQTHIIVYITNSIVPGSHPHFHKTSKEDKISHGHGVKSIHEIAKRYYGDAHYDVKDDQVILKIMLQK